MPQQIINGVGKAGFRSLPTGGGSSFDTDAQAFITATAITDTTQKNAINDLVLDLKAAGVWTKMKALYPMVGGTATTHKFNLKDPRDIDAAYRLSFQGGWTHSSTGALPNGTTGYADTKLVPNTALTNNSTHILHYSRTQSNPSVATFDMGTSNGTSGAIFSLSIQLSNILYADSYNSVSNRITASNTTSLGWFMNNRTSSTSFKTFKNGVQLGTTLTAASTGFSSLGGSIYIGCLNNSNAGSPLYYSNRETAFSSIGDGLTDLESNLFYQIVEKYQYALGRNINTSKSFYFNRNYSNETNAFIFNGAISDATQQSAINTLVNDLKAAGIWTKMKALYPMVGGTALAHKFNLLNPVDSTSAYALTFAGGWTHSSTGALPNGSNAYADTFLTPSTALSLNNTHISNYVRTNTSFGDDMGALYYTATYSYSLFHDNRTPVSGVGKILSYNQSSDALRIESNETDARGHLITSRTSSTSHKILKNGVLRATQTTAPSTFYNGLPLNSMVLGGVRVYNGVSTSYGYSNKECAFSSIGDGLTDAEATTFYNAVQAFQTTLGRQV